MRRVAILLLVVCTLISCKAKPKVAAPLPRPAIPEALIQQYIAQGDASFAKQHLYGWRQAEIAYAKAYELDARQPVREKLLLTRFLIATREDDEDIAGRGLDQVIQELCKEPADGRWQALCEIARAYQQGFGAAFWQDRADRPRALDRSLFAISESPLEAALYLLYVKTFGLKPELDPADNPYEKFRDLPLFLYSSFGPNTLKRLGELEKSFPDFAELLAFAGEGFFQNSSYKSARAYFHKALALIPEYTRALNGLGNLYLFILEDYENALKTYGETLRFDPRNSAGLFGKGATLHHLGRFEESIAVLEDMLKTDLTRKGRSSQLQVRYYRGEARYYQAYDYHLLREPQAARAKIDLAKQDLPDSPEVNYLSGLLYFNEHRLQEAKRDFERVLQSGSSNCFAHYYLGLIWADSNHDRMLSSFIGTCACVQVNIRNLESNIQRLPNMDVEPDERAALAAKLAQRLANYRVSAREVVENMSTMLAELQGKKNWKAHLDLMNGMIKDLQSTSGK